jgi:hypothetical protein
VERDTWLALGVLCVVHMARGMSYGLWVKASRIQSAECSDLEMHCVGDAAENGTFFCVAG